MCVLRQSVELRNLLPMHEGNYRYMTDKERIEFLEEQNLQYFQKILNLEKAVKLLQYELGVKQSEIDELNDLIKKDLIIYKQELNKLRQISKEEMAIIKLDAVYNKQLKQITAYNSEIKSLRKTVNDLIIKLNQK